MANAGTMKVNLLKCLADQHAKILNLKDINELEEVPNLPWILRIDIEDQINIPKIKWGAITRSCRTMIESTSKGYDTKSTKYRLTPQGVRFIKQVFNK